MFENKMKVIKNARVDVDIIESKDNYSLLILVEGEYRHIFDKKAKETKMISQMEIKSIKEYFQGGTYVFLDGSLIDYRISGYNGYLRSDEEIAIMSEELGIEKPTKGPYKNAVRGELGTNNQFRRNTLSNGIFLGGEGKIFDLGISELGEGGEFENKLVHRWSPFDKDVIITLETKRLVCENGMVGMSPFVTKKVPIVNRVQEHLDLVSVQLAPAFNDILKNRFTSMTKQPASLKIANDAYFSLSERVKSLKVDKDPIEYNKEKNKLGNLVNLTNVRRNLSSIYETDTFNKKELLNTLPSNISQYDLFNILTEASSHTSGTEENNIKLQKHINYLVFDELSNKKNVKPENPIFVESNHKKAFFG